MSLGRVANIAANDSPTEAQKYVSYKYLGASMIVDANHPGVTGGLRLTYDAGVTATGHYPGLDRFGRVVWQTWKRTSGSTAADRYFYGYDRSGNRKWRAERSNVSTGSGRDEAYVYDGLDRLVGAKRGILPSGAYQAPYPGDATKDGKVDGDDTAAVTANWDTTGEGRKTWTQGELNGDGYVNNYDAGMVGGNWAPGGVTEDLARQWSWTLTPTGNWSAHKQDNNGDGDPNDAGDVNQTRTHDNANQILTISGVTYAPLYDQAGSNVRGPRPADPNANNAAHFRYDAWNRLATIHLDNGNTAGTLDANDTLLATYRYDGLNRRVMKVVDVDGNSVTDYMYHNESWQIVEIRRGVNQTPTAAAYKQFAYDIRYIDSPVCRWWDKDSDGTMEPAAGEMQYFTNDGNFNTTALVDANSGGVVERYLYDPYGKPTVLNGASGAEKDPNVSEWSPDADNKSDWDNEVLFCGYWYDPETGLYHVRERYYDPITGTWKTRDRILYPDGMNLYQYVRSSPAAHVDWDGAQASSTASASTAPATASTPATQAAPSTTPPPYTKVSVGADGTSYTARLENSKDDLWPRIAAGELTECPTRITLPSSIEDALSEALSLTMKTNREHGGAIMGVPPSITTWGPIAGEKRLVDPRLASPKAYRKDIWGTYHAHTKNYVGGTPDYSGARSSLSTADILAMMNNEHFLTLARDCKCTMALVLLKSNLKGKARTRDWVANTDYLDHASALIMNHREDPDAYRSREKARAEEQEQILANEGSRFGTCYYMSCAKKQNQLDLKQAKP